LSELTGKGRETIVRLRDKAVAEPDKDLHYQTDCGPAGFQSQPAEYAVAPTSVIGTTTVLHNLNTAAVAI
jgi:hypothetical protein